MQLKDKVIVITGGAQGLGLSMAQALGGKGAKLALLDINPAALDSAVSLLQQQGIQANGYNCDITDEDAVIELFNTVSSDFGAINGLINNAGIIRDSQLVKNKDGALNSMSLNQWNQVITTNLTGTFLCGREAAASMIKLDCEGLIINISSIAKAGNFGQTNYAAAKAGVAAMAVTWAKELARYNIRSAAIAPGFIATEMTSSMPVAAQELIAENIPSKRLGTPEDIAQTAVFLFENDYINGRVIEVDGGLRI